MKFVFLCVVFLTTQLFSQKVNYAFMTDPIDVVIPCSPKDRDVLDLCIEGIRTHGGNIRRIIVVSSEKFTDQAEWFNERSYPFTKADVAMAIFDDMDTALTYMSSPNRLGWIYQKLLKLYAPLVIPDISSNVLVLDADTIFLNPVEFTDSDGAPRFTGAGEYNQPYFDHMKKLIPWLKRETDYSGIAYHMLFQKCVIDDLFETIEKIHNLPPWKALCKCITQLDWATLSEYEIYFNFILARSEQGLIRTLKWNNISSLKKLDTYQKAGYHYVSCHSWMREN